MADNTDDIGPERDEAGAEDLTPVGAPAVNGAEVGGAVSTDRGWSDPEDEDVEDEETERDPVVGWLMALVLMLVVVFLVAGVSVALYVLSMRGAPRTAAEREITLAEAATQEKEGKDDYHTFVRLAYSYAQAGRYSDAVGAIDHARKLGKKEKRQALIDLAEADILATQKRYEQALEIYNRAEKESEAEFKAELEQMVEQGIVMPVTNSVLIEVLVGRARVYQSLNKPDEALKDLEKAIELDPMSADVLVMIGDLRLAKGEEQKAEEAYSRALDFIPDYPPAVSGMQKVKEGK